MLKQPIHVYFGLLDAVDTPMARAACMAMLSLDEKEGRAVRLRAPPTTVPASAWLSPRGAFSHTPK